MVDKIVNIDGRFARAKAFSDETEAAEFTLANDKMIDCDYFPINVLLDKDDHGLTAEGYLLIEQTEDMRYYYPDFSKKDPFALDSRTENIGDSIRSLFDYMGNPKYIAMWHGKEKKFTN